MAAATSPSNRKRQPASILPAAIILLGVFLSCPLPVQARGEEGEWKRGEVAILTAENMTTFVRAHPKVLVEFYAPWCGHCKSLEPEYNKAAEMLAQQDAKSVLAKVDATAEKSLAGKYDIKGYPTLKYFGDDSGSKMEKAIDYEGGRTADSIVEYLLKREKNNIKVVKSVDEGVAYLSEKSAEGGLLVVLAESDKAKQKKLKVIKKLASGALLDLQVDVCIVDDTKTSTSSSISYVRGRNVLKSAEFQAGWDDRRVVMDENKFPWKSNGIVKFAQLAWYQFIGGRIMPTERYVLSSLPVSTAMIVVHPEGKFKESEIIDILKPSIEKYNDFLKFTFADINGLSEQSLGFKKEVQDPQIIVVDRRTSDNKVATAGSNKKYYTKGPWSGNELEAFFDKWEQGQLKPFMKSAPVPENDGKDPEGGTRVVVADTWESIVLDPKTDVFIEYYAPWCGHCKELEPHWTKLAQTIHKKYPSVVIAKMDATENDTADVTGYPTLHFYPAGERKARSRMVYGGERKFDALLDYVENTAESLDETKDEL